jgi:hypothetical protein
MNHCIHLVILDGLDQGRQITYILLHNFDLGVSQLSAQKFLAWLGIKIDQAFPTLKRGLPKGSANKPYSSD